MPADDLIQRAADAVRDVIAEAERRAQEIVGEAEEQAKRIRAEAEREARERLDQVRQTLTELEKGLGGSTPSEPEAPAPEPSPPQEAAAQPVVEPTPPPPPPPPSTPSEAPASSGGDASAARLVAMKLALDGTSRDEARAQLAADYDLPDLDAMLDEVYAKAGR